MAEWASIKLGDNAELQKIMSAASDASSLVNTNIGIAKTTLELAKIFLMGIPNPALLLLAAVADEIDNLVNDFRQTGLYTLEVFPGEHMAGIKPRDENGNPIKMTMSKAGMTLKYTAAAAAGTVTDFGKWLASNTDTSVDPTDEDSIKAAVDENPSFHLYVGGKGVKPSETDFQMTEFDEDVGMWKMNPTQVLATVKQSIKDELDPDRPVFSDGADVGGVVVIIGFSKISDLPNFADIIGSLAAFFGNTDTGLLKGLELFGNTVKSIAEAGTQDPIPVTISDVRGERKTVVWTNKGRSPAGPDKIAGNTPRNFQFPFAVGDTISLGTGGTGVVTEVVSTTDDTELIAEGITSQTQQLKIRANGPLDNGLWMNPMTGVRLQRTFPKQFSRVRQTSGGETTVEKSWRYLNVKEVWDLVNDKPEYNEATDKTTSPPSNLMSLEDAAFEDTFEYKGTTPPAGHAPYDMATGFWQTTSGVIRSLDKPTDGPPPNWNSVKLEDLMPPLGNALNIVSAFAQFLRNIAVAPNDSISQMIAFLDKKIDELDKINEQIQAVLSYFEIGLPAAGVYSITIPPETGGMTKFMETIEQAENRPPDSLTFSCGFVILGGAATTKVLTKLLSGA